MVKGWWSCSRGWLWVLWPPPPPLLLSYLRMYRRCCSTYESASLRMFRLGRTDTIRSASVDSLNFARAMDDSAKLVSPQQQLFLVSHLFTLTAQVSISCPPVLTEHREGGPVGEGCEGPQNLHWHGESSVVLGATWCMMVKCLDQSPEGCGFKSQWWYFV